MEFRENEVIAVLPGMMDMGSVYDGVSCNIIKTMVRNNGVTEEFLSKKLKADPETMHEVVRRMTDEGIVMSMSCGKSAALFLTDRPGWIRKLDSYRRRTPRENPSDGMISKKRMRWTGRDSNSRPLPCQGNDLPTDLPAQQNP